QKRGAGHAPETQPNPHPPSPATTHTATPKRNRPIGASQRQRSVPATDPPGKLQVFVISPPSWEGQVVAPHYVEAKRALALALLERLLRLAPSQAVGVSNTARQIRGPSE